MTLAFGGAADSQFGKEAHPVPFDSEHYPFCFHHNGLHCLPALNGATGSLGNFPQCLPGRTCTSTASTSFPIARSRACPYGLERTPDA